MEATSEANEVLKKNVEALSEDNEALIAQVDVLDIQQQLMDMRLKSLTQAQLQSELLIALQNKQVDSLRYERAKDSLILDQKELVLAEQQSTLELKESQRNLFLALASIGGLLALGLFFRFSAAKKYNTQLEKKNQIIEEEKARAEALLLNILPAMVAKELKENGAAKAKKYKHATVFFSDFKNFSAIAERLSPEKLVSELDYYFKTFDDIIGKYNLEKIKTIGDSYMCVGGLPDENQGEPEDVIRAALEIQSYLNAWKKEREVSGEPFFEARIGIHTGPLVAGVVGSRKFAYDIWGDTVNVAARLETNSTVGKVNVSATTYELIKSKFDCESRGKIPVKNRGEIEMYFVNGLKV